MKTKGEKYLPNYLLDLTHPLYFDHSQHILVKAEKTKTMRKNKKTEVQKTKKKGKETRPK